MSEKLYVIKCSDCFITDNYCNIQEAYNNYGCAKARVDYFVNAGVPKVAKEGRHDWLKYLGKAELDADICDLIFSKVNELKKETK